MYQCETPPRNKVVIKIISDETRHKQESIILKFGISNVIRIVNFPESPPSWIPLEFGKNYHSFLNYQSTFNNIYGQRKCRMFSTGILKIQIALDIANGMNPLHQKGYRHGDLNIKNVVLVRILESNKLVWKHEAKIIDFEHSSPNDFVRCSIRPPPQVPLEEIFSFNSDIYSFGHLLAEIFAEKPITKRLLPNEYELQFEALDPLTTAAKLLCKQCLSNNRPTWIVIIQTLQKAKDNFNSSLCSSWVMGKDEKILKIPILNLFDYFTYYTLKCFAGKSMEQNRWHKCVQKVFGINYELANDIFTSLRERRSSYLQFDTTNPSNATVRIKHKTSL